MDTTLVLLVVLAFAFAVTHLERKLLGERVRFVSDAEYLLLGVAFGPLGAQVLSLERMAQLEPLQSVITGFVGFLVGLPLVRLRARGMARADLVFSIGATALTVAAVMVGLMAAAMFLLPVELQQPLELTVVAAATLAFGAVAASRSSILHTIIRTRADGPVSRLLPVTASTGRVVAVAGFGVALAAKRALVGVTTTVGDWVISPGAWVVISVVAGVATAVIFRVFAGEENDKQRLFVATIGLVLLTSGIAHALEFSPLFVGAIAGATVANISPVAADVSAAAARLSHPTVVILLILAGASWSPISEALLWALPVGYVALRMMALRVATGVIGARHPALRGQSRQVGAGLLPMGALAVAIAVNYAMAPATVFTEVVVTTLLLTAVLSSLFGPPSVRTLLRDVGETGRKAHGGDGEDEASLADVAPHLPPIAEEGAL